MPRADSPHLVACECQRRSHKLIRIFSYDEQEGSNGLTERPTQIVHNDTSKAEENGDYGRLQKLLSRVSLRLSKS